MKQQAEILKREVDSLRAAKERNEARERDLLSSVQDYGEYIRMMSLVKTETEKKVRVSFFKLGCHYQALLRHDPYRYKEGFLKFAIHHALPALFKIL